MWNSVSISDLYFLGDRFLARYEKDPWPSPVASQLRVLDEKHDASTGRILGANLTRLYGCSHPHLVSLAPYEEYERRFFPTQLAERVAELKLYMAEYMDRSSIPSSQLGIAAESVAREVFAKRRQRLRIVAGAVRRHRAGTQLRDLRAIPLNADVVGPQGCAGEAA